MSHTTTLTDIIFTDVKALKTAALALAKNGVRCELKENEKPRAYYANQAGMEQAAPYMLHLKDSLYDVGFYPNTSGKGYIAKADFFSGHVERQLGVPLSEGLNPKLAPMGKLYHQYTLAATINAAVSKGYTVERFTKQNGAVQLRIGGMQ